MEGDNINERLDKIEQLLTNLNLHAKEILSFDEAKQYLAISSSTLYKLTSTSQIPHFCPQGKKLYFKRTELEEWLLRNRRSSNEELSRKADAYWLKNKKA